MHRTYISVFIQWTMNMLIAHQSRIKYLTLARFSRENFIRKRTFIRLNEHKYSLMGQVHGIINNLLGTKNHNALTKIGFWWCIHFSTHKWRKICNLSATVIVIQIKIICDLKLGYHDVLNATPCDVTSYLFADGPCVPDRVNNVKIPSFKSPG